MPPPPPAAVADEDPSCTFGPCFCRWLRFCSPRIPHVGPGRDYVRVPRDDRAAWSLLVGFISPSAAGDDSLLRLRRFRVARCGRVLGRSDDALEVLDDLDYKAKSTSATIRSSRAILSADGSSSSLCLFFRELGRMMPPRPVELHLDLTADRRITVSPLPVLQQEPLMPTCPISAATHLWSPYFTQRCPSRLVMRRLDKESRQWVQAGEAIDPPHGKLSINGFVVVRNTIVLSLHPHHLFLAFDCSNYGWNVVATTRSEETEYIPIHHHGFYVDDDDTIYFLRYSTVYAYKLCYDRDQCQYSMAPPTVVDHVFPFRNEGREFLTYLGGRVMCSIWISSPFNRSELHCNCDTLHVLITTFRVMGDNGSNHEPFIPKGVHILHSTCRRMEISPSEPLDCTLCFLQEYEELNRNESAMPPAKKMRENAMAPSMLVESMEARSNVLESSSKLLTCCRNFLNKPPFMNFVMLECSAVQIKKALYIVCQAPSGSTVYEISISDGRLSCQNETLKPRCVIDASVHDLSCPDLLTDDALHVMECLPQPWHFVCDSTKIHAFPHGRSEIYVCHLDMGTVSLFDAKRPIGDEFVSISLVLRVGHKIVAINEHLDHVYYLSNLEEWNHLMTVDPAFSGRKVQLSGYVVLNDESFMVSDAESFYCYLFDLHSCTVRHVMPYAYMTGLLPLTITPWSGRGFLERRSVLAEGFIYTCSEGGLAAYEICEAEGSYCLGSLIYLDFPWRQAWKMNRMCLDYVGKDIKTGDIMFCVVQGDEYYPHPGALPKHPVWITTIQVKTERMPNGSLKPVVICHVDFCTSFIEQAVGPIRTNSCFAVASSL